jgi:hypothetical protein
MSTKQNSPSRKRSRTPLTLDLTTNRWDREVEALSMKGFYAETISKVTSLSEGQVRYRQRAFSVSPRSYRQGEGVVAQAVLDSISIKLDRLKLKHLKP